MTPILRRFLLLFVLTGMSSVGLSQSITATNTSNPEDYTRCTASVGSIVPTITNSNWIVANVTIQYNWTITSGDGQGGGSSIYVTVNGGGPSTPSGPISNTPYIISGSSSYTQSVGFFPDSTGKLAATLALSSGNMATVSTQIYAGGPNPTPALGGARFLGITGNFVADPVNVTTGEFYVNKVDLHISGAFPIDIKRSYSSRNPNLNDVGYGWLTGYPTALIPSADLSTIQAADSDGSVIIFRKQGTTSTWSPQAADNPELASSGSGMTNLFNSTITSTTGSGGTTYLWKLADGSVRTYTLTTFQSLGNPVQLPFITSWTDNRGNTLWFTFGTDANSFGYARLIKIQSSSGGSATLTYSPSGLLTQVSSGDGRSVLYTYLSGDLTEVQLPDGQKFDYQYGTNTDGTPSHLIVAETKPDYRYLQNAYDPQGRVTQQQANVGSSGAMTTTASFNYSVPGQTTVTDALGSPTVYQYSGSLITSITDPLGGVITNSYYASTGAGGYLRSLKRVTDKRGLLTSYTYDGAGNQTQVTVTGDLQGNPTVPSSTATASASYDTQNRLVSSTNTSGVTTALSYGDLRFPYLPTQVVTSIGSTTLRTDKLEYTSQLDAVSPGTLFSNGLLFKKTIALGNTTDQSICTYSYNTAGDLIQKTETTGTTDPAVVQNFSYTSRNELLQEQDADGRTTSFTYDALSRPLTKVVKDESGNILGNWATTYEGNGDVISAAGPFSNPANLVKTTYDGGGRIATKTGSLVQANGTGTGVQPGYTSNYTYLYDAFGNLTSETNIFNQVTSFTYDAVGQTLSKVVAGLKTEKFKYEIGGKLSQYTNPLGGITNKYYTMTGQLKQQQNADGSVLQWTYYTDGRLQKEIQRDGSYWLTTYDDINRVVTHTLTRSSGTVLASTVQKFDSKGNLISSTDQNGFTTQKTYDGLNRPIKITGTKAVTGSSQQVVSLEYGASPKYMQSTNALGETTATTTDAMGRTQIMATYSAGGTLVRATNYSYSPDGYGTTVTEGSGSGAVSSTTYVDTNGRTLLQIAGDGTYSTRVYDYDGNLSSFSDSLRRTTSYTYNTLDQRITEYLPDGAVTNFTYDTAGNLLTRTMPGGSVYQQTYDSAGRKISEQLSSSGVITRQYSYSYYPAGNAWTGLLKMVSGPRETLTTSYDTFLRPQTVTTNGSLAQTKGTTTYAYDRCGRPTSISQSSVGNAAGPATQVTRSYDGYGQLLSEKTTAAGLTISSTSQTWNAAGRRGSLSVVGATLAAPLFAYQYQADGLLTQVTANSQAFAYSYSNGGLLLSKVSPYRSLVINSRDAVGRILQETNTVNGAAAMVENTTWRNDNTLNNYSVTRSGVDAWNESRPYAYNTRGQLTSEGFSSAPAVSNALNYVFDNYQAGAGVRTEARIGGYDAPYSWNVHANTVDAVSRVTQELSNAAGQTVALSGTALGVDHVDVYLDGIYEGQAQYAKTGNPTGAWTLNVVTYAGTHAVSANAVQTNGQFTTATSSVNLTDAGATFTNSFDGEGNLISKTSSTGQAQTLTWDSWGRLIKVSQRDTSNNGYDWTSVYDGLGRRIKTTQQAIVLGAQSGTADTISSTFDPQVEFLEIGVSVNGVQAWKVYGPDLNGRFGALQGTGGLEATIVDSSKAMKGVVSDQFGNGVASVSRTTINWYATRSGGYGPLPGSVAENLTDITRVAEASAWRGHRIDATGFYNLGARHYDPNSGRFLSADPLGHAVSMSLYDFCDGDPVNFFDPDGDASSSTQICIQCHGVSAFGFSGNVNDFAGLATIPGSGPNARTGYHVLATTASSLVAATGVTVLTDGFATPYLAELGLTGAPLTFSSGAVSNVAGNLAAQGTNNVLGTQAGYSSEQSAIAFLLGGSLSTLGSGAGAWAENGFQTTPMTIVASGNERAAALSGSGDPFHVVYSVGDQAGHAAGGSFFDMSTRSLASQTFNAYSSDAYSIFTLPVANAAAVTLDEIPAWSCVTGAMTAFSRGWYSSSGAEMGNMISGFEQGLPQLSFKGQPYLQQDSTGKYYKTN